MSKKNPGSPNGTLSVELSPKIARQVRIAAAILEVSMSQFIRDSVEERLNRLDLPELKAIEEIQQTTKG